MSCVFKTHMGDDVCNFSKQSMWREISKLPARLAAKTFLLKVACLLQHNGNPHGCLVSPSKVVRPRRPNRLPVIFTQQRVPFHCNTCFETMHAVILKLRCPLLILSLPCVRTVAFRKRIVSIPGCFTVFTVVLSCVCVLQSGDFKYAATWSSTVSTAEASVGCNLCTGSCPLLQFLLCIPTILSIHDSLLISIRNPPILGDLDLELECLQQQLGIEIWNVECKNFLSGLDCGMGFYFSEMRIVEWE